MARPKNLESSIKVELTLSPKLVAYLDDLKDMDGFGMSRSEIIRNFVWNEVNELIRGGRLRHGETKATCLWLKGLPKLTPTNIVAGRVNRVHRMPPGPDRWKERSRTFPGIAAAMAAQWSRA